MLREVKSRLSWDSSSSPCGSATYPASGMAINGCQERTSGIRIGDPGVWTGLCCLLAVWPQAAV